MTQEDLTSRLSDPIVIVAVATAFITVVGSYFSLHGELDAINIQIVALQKDEQTRDSQHTIEWATQTVTNTQLAAVSDATKQDLAVLRAELDGILIARERADIPLVKSK